MCHCVEFFCICFVRVFGFRFETTATETERILMKSVLIDAEQQIQFFPGFTVTQKQKKMWEETICTMAAKEEEEPEMRSYPADQSQLSLHFLGGARKAKA